MLNILSKIVGDSNEKAVNKLRPMVDEINEFDAQMAKKSDAELRAVSGELKDELAKGATLDEVLPEAFAAVREAGKRTLGMRHFDVQMIGGQVLHQGKIAEMKTGEGKTLVATLPAYLNSLAGTGVHVVTVNDYLAKRDASWMGAIYHALGLSVGCLQNESSLIYDPEGAAEAAKRAGADGAVHFAAVAGENMRPCTRREAYAADITYGTNNEFGFDYLRDNMVETRERMVQRGQNFAIVDEVDNILIDEARTPLIISGPARDSGSEYRRFSQLAKRLVKDQHYTVEEKHRQISLLPEGIAQVEKLLNVENLYDQQHQALTHFVENAVRAETIFQRDRDYVVQNGEVVIVDEFTGRLMTGRRWSDGLHQAVEAKEGVEVRRETITYATITLQNYFRMYKKLAGMTGTAVTEAEEFFKIYKLEVVQIPTNRQMVRKDQADQIFKTEVAKWNAVAAKVAELHKAGRPSLIGTTSIEKSEQLSELLKKRGIKHEVLNAKQHEREAHIIAQAGRPGSVTVATNMAGRGTDIILGGNADALAIPPDEWKSEHDKVVAAGGLFVVGTERHEARRIDNQLRGRAGRQGDAGETQFFISTEDDLVRRFGGDRIRGAMNLFGWEDDVPIENRIVSRSVEAAQSRVEGHNFEVRKHLVDYDDVVNTHRTVIYTLRRKVLDGEDLRPTVLEYIRKEIEGTVQERLQGVAEGWDVASFYKELSSIFPALETLKNADELKALTPEEITEQLVAYAEKLYEDRAKEFGPELTKTVERAVFLRAIDSEWVEHLTAMENFRQGIGLEAVGQRDPLVQYKRQAFEMFSTLVASIETGVARSIFRVSVARQPQPAPRVAVVASKPAPAPLAGENKPATPIARPLPMQSGPANKGAASARIAQAIASKPSVMAGVTRGHGSDAAGSPKLGRNDPCHCGSGKKFKKCHGVAA